MKQLKDFLNEKVELKTIHGGNNTPTESERFDFPTGCITKISDSYNDSNGNGTWDKNEQGVVCKVTTC